MNTKRQDIVDAVVVALQDIRTVNGYNSDVGLNVYEWLKHSTDSTVRPCLIVRDPKDSVELNEPHVSDRRLTIEIVAQSDGTSAVDNLRGILGDIYKAMKNGDSFGGNIYWIEDGGDEMDGVHEEDLIFSAVVTFTLYYKTGLLDPYTIINC